MGTKMRQRSKSTTGSGLGEAKQKLADEQKLAAARRDPNWPSRLRFVSAGATALLRRAYELALSCSAQANGGAADPKDLHPCTWQLPLLLHATRCLRYAELSSWQLRLAWHLALRLSTSASYHCPPTLPLCPPASPVFPAPCATPASPASLTSPTSPRPPSFPCLTSVDSPPRATDQLAHHRAAGGAALEAARRTRRCWPSPRGTPRDSGRAAHQATRGCNCNRRRLPQRGSLRWRGGGVGARGTARRASATRRPRGLRGGATAAQSAHPGASWHARPVERTATAGDGARAHHGAAGAIGAGARPPPFRTDRAPR